MYRGTDVRYGTTENWAAKQNCISKRCEYELQGDMFDVLQFIPAVWNT